MPKNSSVSHPKPGNADSSLIVIKLSGSLFFSPQFGAVVRVLKTSYRGPMVLVAGGGATARRYIEAGRKLGSDQASLDEMGIAVSRLNAAVLKAALGKTAYDKIPRTLAEVSDAFQIPPPESRGRIVVCGGLHPGQSTNAVAALIAEKMVASSFINATDVPFVYDKDPKRFKNARPIENTSTKELGGILKTESFGAGGYDLMDLVALKIIERSKIETVIVKCDPPTLRAVLLGKKFKGTRITF